MGALRAIGSVIPEAKAMRSPKLHAKELHAKEHRSKKFRSTAARHLPLVALVAVLSAFGAVSASAQRIGGFGGGIGRGISVPPRINVAPGMMRRKRGRIVTLSSIAAFIGRDHGSIYATAKAGVVHYTRCLAAQLRPYDVTVNSIAPGGTRTGRFIGTGQGNDPKKMVTEGTLDRVATVDEVARTVAIFAGPEIGRAHV